MHSDDWLMVCINIMLLLLIVYVSTCFVEIYIIGGVKTIQYKCYNVFIGKLNMIPVGID